MSEERLGAVVYAARVGVVAGPGGIGAVVAEFILVVGLLVPVPVVEIPIVVGGLGAVQPVDGHARAGGAGVVPGVGVGGAADRPEARVVGLDGAMPASSEVLDEGVVGRDFVGRAVGLRGREEQQPELVAGAEPGGDEAPVVGHRDLGGRGRHPPQARHHHLVGLRGVVRPRHLHLDRVRALRERDLEAGRVRVRVRERRAAGVLDLVHGVAVVHRRGDGDFVHAVGHRRRVGRPSRGKRRGQRDPGAVVVRQLQIGQGGIGGEGGAADQGTVDPYSRYVERWRPVVGRSTSPMPPLVIDAPARGRICVFASGMRSIDSYPGTHAVRKMHKVHCLCFQHRICGGRELFDVCS